MTTAMQRLVAAINGESADRIPVFCNLIDQGARELGMSLKAYYSKGEYVAEGQLRMLEKYGHDNVWGLFYVGREAELLGCREIIFAENGPPNVEDFVIKSHADIAALQVPEDIGAHPLFEEELKCMRILKTGGHLSLEFPNRFYYIELHTKLPSLEWMPRNIRDAALKMLSARFSPLSASVKVRYLSIVTTMLQQTDTKTLTG